MSLVLTPTEFKEMFPEFSGKSDAYIERFITESCIYISSQNYVWQPEVRRLAIGYMTGHLITLSTSNEDGSAKGENDSGKVVSSASVGGVSVSIQPPIARNAFEQWVQTTPYGKKYWALLTVHTPCGLFWVGAPRAFGIR